MIVLKDKSMKRYPNSLQNLQRQKCFKTEEGKRLMMINDFLKYRESRAEVHVLVIRS